MAAQPGEESYLDPMEARGILRQVNSNPVDHILEPARRHSEPFSRNLHFSTGREREAGDQASCPPLDQDSLADPIIAAQSPAQPTLARKNSAGSARAQLLLFRSQQHQEPTNSEPHPQEAHPSRAEPATYHTHTPLHRPSGLAVG